VSESFCGEIRMFGGTFAPVGWALCHGQLLPINEYDLLFNLIGTTYGGDGQSTFSLPDLQGRMPIGQGTGPSLPTYYLGETGGAESVTLTKGQMAIHSHALQATKSEANANVPLGNLTAASPSVFLYYDDAPSPTANLAPGAIMPSGGGKAHDNMQPYLVVNFIISLYGTYPPPN
jgi:microcystin-dependent protein